MSREDREMQMNELNRPRLHQKVQETVRCSRWEPYYQESHRRHPLLLLPIPAAQDQAVQIDGENVVNFLNNILASKINLHVNCVPHSTVLTGQAADGPPAHIGTLRC